MTRLLTALWFLVCFVSPSLADSSVTPMMQAISACAAVLVPEVTLINASDSAKKSWLRLVTKETYESAKHNISVSGDINLLGLIGASGNNTYEQFDEARSKYLELDSGKWQEDYAISVFHQSLPATAGDQFVRCVGIAAHSNGGLTAWFAEETADYAILHVRFYAVPGVTVSYKNKITGGKGAPLNDTLPHDGETQYNLRRSPNASQIRIVITSTTPAGISASAVSVRPGPGAQPPQPRFITKTVWSLLTADPPEPKTSCEFVIRNKQLEITALDVDPASDLSLNITGKTTLPEPGRYEIGATGESDYAVLARRKLDDFQIGESSSITILGPGKASTLLLKTPVKYGNCTKYVLRFANSEIIVRQPPAVWVPSADIRSEVISLGAANYIHDSGNIACNQGPCGDRFYANVGAKASSPISTIVEATVLGHFGSGWWRCQAPEQKDCLVSGEFTSEPRTDARASCVGGSTCFIWRLSINEVGGADTITFRYREPICLRYCPR